MPGFFVMFASLEGFLTLRGINAHKKDPELTGPFSLHDSKKVENLIEDQFVYSFP